MPTLISVREIPYSYIPLFVLTGVFLQMNFRFKNVVFPLCCLPQTQCCWDYDWNYIVFIFSFFFKLSYNLHTVKFTLFERVSYRYNSLLFSIFTKFWKYHHYLISDHIHHLQSNSTSISSNFQFSLPIFPSSQLLGTTNLFPVSVDLPILGSLYKWNHRIGDHLCLAFLTQYNVLRIHPCCSMCQCFIPMVKYYSIVWIYHIVYPLICV